MANVGKEQSRRGSILQNPVFCSPAFNWGKWNINDKCRVMASMCYLSGEEFVKYVFFCRECMVVKKGQSQHNLRAMENKAFYFCGH